MSHVTHINESSAARVDTAHISQNVISLLKSPCNINAKLTLRNYVCYFYEMWNSHQRLLFDIQQKQHTLFLKAGFYSGGTYEIKGRNNCLRNRTCNLLLRVELPPASTVQHHNTHNFSKVSFVAIVHGNDVSRIVNVLFTRCGTPIGICSSRDACGIPCRARR